MNKWILEEGKFTYIENGYRVEKVEIAYGWRKYTAEPLNLETDEIVDKG